MTRIIGGSAGGRRIATPRGTSTRPTSDRVREALFSAIEAWCGSLAGLRVLDLYAGSGAVGLEARSRGAELVTLVEYDRRTSAVVAQNVRQLGFARGVELVTGSVRTTLTQRPEAPYDLVFSDPPYPLPTGDVEADLAALVSHGWLAPGALVVVERSSRDGALTWPEGLMGERDRKYGETRLWYGRAPGDHPAEGQNSPGSEE